MNHRISPEQAADQLGVSRDFVMAIINAGELPATDERAPGVKRPRYRIDPDDLVRWRESRTVKMAIPARPMAVRMPRAVGVIADERRRQAERRRRKAAT